MSLAPGLSRGGSDDRRRHIIGGRVLAWVVPVGKGCVMPWWAWVIIVLVVVVVAVGGFLVVQARRRAGGVIISDPGPRDTR